MSKKSKLNKWFAALMTLCLVFGMLPTTAFAAPSGEYTITFDANGGTFEANTTVMRMDTENQMIAELPTPAREGYDFVGWWIDPAGETDRIYDNAYFSSDMTLYAQWQLVLTVPIEKIVVWNSNQAPKSVEFRYRLSTNNGDEIMNIEIDMPTISTNGAGTYTGEIQLMIPSSYGMEPIDSVEGLILEEVNDGKSDWTYDNSQYLITSNGSNHIKIEKDGQPVQKAAFTNTYSYVIGYKNDGPITSYYTIDASAGKGGSISPEGACGYEEKLDYTYTITPDKGYKIKDVLVDGESVGAVKSYTFVNLSAAHTIKASFLLDYVESTVGKITKYYILNASAGKGGSISPEGSMAVDEKLDKTFTITPKIGYVISDVLVDGKSVGAVQSYTFKNISDAHTIKAVFALAEELTKPEIDPNLDFKDIQKSDWFYDDVAYVFEKGLMSGTSSTTFSPNMTTTRGMIVTVLYRRENSPAVTGGCPFDDVQSGSYYENAITWAAANNIVGGYGNAKFGPNDNITREQMATILNRYAQYKGYDVSKSADLTGFTDANSISGYALPPMQWANANGLITGTNATTLAPAGNTTRGQTAAILHRFCENIAK